MRPLDLLWATLSFMLGLVVPRDPRLVVFCGRHYGGNTAPLCERCEHFDLRGVWLTSREHEAAEHGVSTRSLAGVWAAARAGSVVLTHTLDDLSPLHVGRGARVFNAWHGMPLKRISRADPGFAERAHAASNVREQARYVGMFVTSAAMAEIFEQTFGLPRDRIHVTGQPRTDALVSGTPGDLSGRYAEPLPPHRHRILYCPTWREGEATRLFPFDNHDPGRLQATLERLDALMFVRTHPNDAARLQRRDGRLIPMQGELVAEVTDVLSAFDALVTDYSSVYYDYLLLDRPTIFLDYDLDHYQKSPGFYRPFEEVAAGPRPRDLDTFLAALESALAGDPAHADARARVRDWVHLHVDAGATDRVLAIIAGSW